eukprot:TRINITY_DN17672_c0_g1_i1.p1 TRINITY_DN17672_c0_g1~~TRINITY_DN17672_c0_g1_i1.p1  ORF type:complete len:612 (+),score=87.04 TRINITY_DN17672_c0_g1_i1:23-1837(+)
MSSEEPTIKRADSRRKRNMLKAYYSIPQGEEEQNQNRDELDAAGCDVGGYVKKIVAKGGIQKLLAKDVSLGEEIKELDGELQMLVYGNYTNFISATKLVSGMRGSVAGMGDLMKELETGLQGVETTHKTVEQSLSATKSEIQRLHHVSSSLQKVRFIAELPDRLDYYISTQRYEEALRCWSAGERILTKYVDIKSFANVRESCVGIVSELEANLIGQITAKGLESFESFTSLEKIFKLLNRPGSEESLAKCIDIVSKSLEESDKKDIEILFNETRNAPFSIHGDEIERRFKIIGDRRDAWSNVVEEPSSGDEAVFAASKKIQEEWKRRLSLHISSLVAATPDQQQTPSKELENGILSLNSFFSASVDQDVINSVLLSLQTDHSNCLKVISFIHFLTKSRMSESLVTSGLDASFSYVLSESSRVALTLRDTGYFSSTNKFEKLGVSEGVKIMVESIKDIHSAVKTAIPPLKSKPKDQRSKGSGVSKSSRGISLIGTGIDRVFASGPSFVTRPAEIDSGVVMSCLVTRVLRTVLELTRAGTFPTSGFLQQLELDTAYLDATLGTMCKTSQDFQNILKLLVSTAVERTISAEQLEPEILDACVREAL